MALGAKNIAGSALWTFNGVPQLVPQSGDSIPVGGYAQIWNGNAFNFYKPSTTTNPVAVYRNVYGYLVMDYDHPTDNSQLVLLHFNEVKYFSRLGSWKLYIDGSLSDGTEQLLVTSGDYVISPAEDINGTEGVRIHYVPTDGGYCIFEPMSASADLIFGAHKSDHRVDLRINNSNGFSGFKTVAHSTVHSGGSFAVKHTEVDGSDVSGAYSALDNDCFLGVINLPALGNFNVILPASDDCEGRIYWVKDVEGNISAGVNGILVTDANARKIDGASSFLIGNAAHECKGFISIGRTGWAVLTEYL